MGSMFGVGCLGRLDLIPMPTKPRLFDQGRSGSALNSIRTEQAYLGWMKRFILGQTACHGEPRGRSFLTHLGRDLAFYGPRLRTRR
jgi:hypothetical protein